MRRSLSREPAPPGHGRARRGRQRPGVAGGVRARDGASAVSDGAGPLAGAGRGAAVGGMAVAVVVGLVLFYRRREAAARAADGLRPWLGRLVGGLAEGLSALGAPGRLAVSVVTALAIPATVAAMYASGAQAFGIALPPGG